MTQLAISFDPSARKHGGNENSRAAFKRVDVESDELYVLQLIAMSPNGMTSAEIEQAWKPKNRFSGTFNNARISGGRFIATGSGQVARCGGRLRPGSSAPDHTGCRKRRARRIGEAMSLEHIFTPEFHKMLVEDATELVGEVHEWRRKLSGMLGLLEISKRECGHEVPEQLLSDLQRLINSHKMSSGEAFRNRVVRRVSPNTEKVKRTRP
jgi:hypothetical protein